MRLHLLLATLGLLAASAAACNTVQSGMGLFTSRGGSGGAQEAVYSVDWWTRADETFNQPYRPLQTASPALDPNTGNVFALTSDGRISAWAPPGRELWTVGAASQFNAGPTWSAGTLYVGAAKGELAAYDAGSGKKLWSYESARS